VEATSYRHLGIWDIADSANALTLSEANYPPVHYIPRADVDLGQLERSDHSTYCLYKGDAAYFHIAALGDFRAQGIRGMSEHGNGVNAVWTYEQPYKAVGEIAEYLAFYRQLVEITEVSEEAVHSSSRP
jgi:uncharacterized protein (DUF427 family)